MKKIKIILLIALVVMLTIFIVFNYINSLREVKIIVNDIRSVTLISKINNQELKTFSSTKTLSLRDGSYCLKPNDDRFNRTLICFTVYKQNKEFDASFDYSKSYLDNLLKKERSSIDEVIKNTYPNIINDFKICPGSLIKNGQWYGGVLVQKKNNPSDNSDYYHFIINKKDGEWRMVAKPSIVLSSNSFKDIPFEILSEANKMTLCL